MVADPLFVRDLAYVFGAALVGGALAWMLRQPLVLGYVVGGIFGRTVAATADRTEAALREVSADTLVAGAIGLVAGVLTGAGIAWPLFFVPDPLIAIPLFGIVVAVLGYLGFRVGASKRDGVLAMFGGSTGVPARGASPSALPQVIDSSVAISTGSRTRIVRTEKSMKTNASRLRSR